MSTHSRKTILLATDQQRSVLNGLDNYQPHPIAYAPYGHRPPENGLVSLLGFNGELPDPVSGHYHLGIGYRQFNPVLMRFNSPDSWSPFGAGGINAYSYCVADPVNRVELDGHKSVWVRFAKGFKNRIGIRTPSKFDTVRPKIRSRIIKAPTSTASEPSEQLITRELSLGKSEPESAIRTLIADTRFKSTPENSRLAAQNRGSHDLTRARLLNRRTKSLDHVPETPDIDIKDFYAGKQGEPGSLTSKFASDPTGTHARLYQAMDSELKSFPLPRTQRTIRTGGLK